MKRLKFWEYMVLLFLSAIFVLLFSSSTSPISPYCFGSDSAQFMTIGMGWREGLMPYQNLFDHKGPVIFFINYMGFLMGSKYGVCLIQILFAFVTGTGLYRIGCMCFKGKCTRALSFLFVIALSITNYEYGNSVEEYCLPFLVYATYFLLHHAKNERGEGISYTLYFFFGVTLAVCLGTRLTNIVPILGYVFVTALNLLKKHKKNLFIGSFVAVLGFFAIMLPFFIYFRSCFSDLMDGMVLFNAKYMGSKESFLLSMEKKKVLKYLLNFFPYYCVAGCAVARLIKKDYSMALAFGMTFLAESYVFLSGDGYRHYILVCFVQPMLFMYELHSLGKRYIKVVCLLFVFTLSVFCFSTGTKASADRIAKYQTYRPAWGGLVSDLPKDASFLAFGGRTLKSVYVAEGRVPCFRHFAIQEEHASYSEETRTEILVEVSSLNADYILTDGDCELIQPVLDEYYALIGEEGRYLMYRKEAL